MLTIRNGIQYDSTSQFPLVPWYDNMNWFEHRNGIPNIWSENLLNRCAVHSHNTWWICKQSKQNKRIPPYFKIDSPLLLLLVNIRDLAEIQSTVVWYDRFNFAHRNNPFVKMPVNCQWIDLKIINIHWHLAQIPWVQIL